MTRLIEFIFGHFFSQYIESTIGPAILVWGGLFALSFWFLHYAGKAFPNQPIQFTIQLLVGLALGAASLFGVETLKQGVGAVVVGGIIYATYYFGCVQRRQCRQSS